MPPPVALDHLGSAVARARARRRAGAAAEPRWLALDALHLTLAFFGQVPDARVAGLTAALGAVPEPPTVHLRLSGAGTFPERGAPRVLWVGVDGDLAELAELARGIAAAAAGVGVVAANEGRPYRPHLTLARWPAAARADRRLATALGGYAGPHFAVAGWVLMRSHPQSRYETIARW